MKLLFATKNEYKFNLMKERLSCFKNIELVNPKMLDIDIDVIENGKTAEENACIKARAYYKATKLPTIAEDSGLYIDKFKKSEQPGLFVKRINGIDGLSDKDILKYYIDKLKEYNGRSLAHYYSGVCIIDEFGNEYSDVIEEDEFLMTTEKSKKVGPKGSILNCISYDIDAGKYFDERNEEEIKNHYHNLDNKHRELINNIFINQKAKIKL